MDLSTISTLSTRDAARAAVIQTLPLFEMMRMRAATTARRHPTLGFAGSDAASRLRWVNQFTHTHRRLGPEDREVVSPNNDTVYSNAWLDLSGGPVVIATPDMGERYWTLGLLDAWTNPFAYVGRRTTGNRAQRTLVHGPGWRGEVPADITQVIAAPGQDVWLIGRVLVDDTPVDVEHVRSLQLQFSMRRPDGGDAAVRLDTLLDGRVPEAPPAPLYQAIVDQALERNPFPAGERPLWPVSRDLLPQALSSVYEELRQADQPQGLGGGWALPVAVRTHWGDDLLTRARVARNLIGALGIEEAMYPTAEVDADGQVLHGSHAYELRFPPGGGPRVGAFWSLTMYRRSDCLFVANPIDRYSIGDRTPGLRTDADGSLAIRVQASDPGPGFNWLPAPPGEPFYVVLRLYQPQREHLDFHYRYPPLRRL
ncbi:DUF1254 domain-containing protein [Ramlibacter sp. USB13]|uniref:DUF1254 domain-containing protein n=1 Tax=Ramlibacter cellulosilyticus TaxID=2764187 RepID=A0A923MVE3_9BURK|nr:DUF1254 domain-containing protein [Ramlibacter cellulosilyticus]MBC5785746.1 DUF1254 domain-containing protein [Ramlibacter cellulosilyticus]